MSVSTEESCLIDAVDAVDAVDAFDNLDNLDKCRLLVDNFRCVESDCEVCF